MEKLRSQIAQFAASPYPVLIEGRVGQRQGARRPQPAPPVAARSARPYLALNCAALAPTLVEADALRLREGRLHRRHRGEGRLFRGRPGRHAVPRRDRRAAARAAGEAPARARERRVPARGRDAAPRLARAASSPPPTATCASALRQGSFRADLYHRLSVLSLQVAAAARARPRQARAARAFPPARTRANRAPQPFSLDDDGRGALAALRVPGQRARAAQHRDPPHHQVRRPAGVARPSSSPSSTSRRRRRPRQPVRRTLVGAGAAPARARGGFNLDETLKAWERAYIEAALRITRGNMSQAAKLLGVNRTTLYSRMDSQRGEAVIAMALYLEHFGLKEPPFRITPHTDFFFDGADRGATLEALIYAVLHDEGIVKVSGEVGSGKTMLCRVLMERLPAARRHHLSRHALARARRDPARDRRRARASRCPEQRTAVALRELQEHLIGRYGAGPPRRHPDRRSARDARGDARGGAPAVQPGIEPAQAAADRAVRPARARRHPRQARPAPAARPHHPLLSACARSPAPKSRSYLSFRMRAAGLPRPGSLRAARGRAASRAPRTGSRGASTSSPTRRCSRLSPRTATPSPRATCAPRSPDSEFAAVRPRRRARTLAVAAAAARRRRCARRRGAVAVDDEAAAGRRARSVPNPPPRRVAAPVAAPLAAPLPTVARRSLRHRKARRAPRLTSARSRRRRLERYSPARPSPARRAPRGHPRRCSTRAPDERYSIELFMTDNSDPARMERFLLRARDLVPARGAVRHPDGGRRRVSPARRVRRISQPRRRPRRAEKRLPPRYQQAFRTAPRSFGELRSQI